MSILDASSAASQSLRARPQHAIRQRTTLPVSFRWLTRARRILLLLGAIWVINVLDLGYTLLESLHSGFVELNPVAAKLIGESSTALVGYKLALLLISSTILLIYRRHRVAELGCWLLLTIYLHVAICWRYYYEQRLTSFDDPAVNVDPIIGCCLHSPG